MDIKSEFLKLAVVEQVKFDEIAKILCVDKAEVSKLWEKYKEDREYLSNLRKIWKSKFKNVSTYESFWDFKKWHEETDKICCYCKITQEEINLLREKNLIETKRSRGFKLEIDRKLPNQEYDNIDNLVFSCYWCNNAKTDEFSYEEFLPIGKEIEIIWRKRLSK